MAETYYSTGRRLKHWKFKSWQKHTIVLVVVKAQQLVFT